METTLRDREARKKMKSLVKDISICMFCTEDETGHMRSRPMTTTEIDDAGDFWFFASKDAPFVYRKNACLNYSHPDKNEYLCVSGQAMIIDDEERIRQLWNPHLKDFYPQGISDPKLILLKVTPNEVSYWDLKGGKVVTLFDMIDSMLSHKEQEEHGKLIL